MMLAYKTRDITHDVDAVVQPSHTGFELASEVAAEFDLPADWLNDNVRQFTAPTEGIRALDCNIPGVTLRSPTASYLLAMKALACRQPLPGYRGDMDDLRFLIEKLEIKTVDAIQKHIDRFYPDDVITPEHEILLRSLIEEIKHED